VSSPDVSVPLTGASPVSLADPRRWQSLGLLALVQFMFALDTTIVNPALPTIKNDLHFSTAGLAWVVNGYTLVAGGFLIFGGRLADLYGRRRLFMTGTVIFILASAASGLAQNPGTLVGARFAQGLGEALASPAALSLVVLLFPDAAERAKAIGLWGAIIGLGATIGVVLSGMIVDWLDWRWIFLVNVPIALIVVFVVPRQIGESKLGGTHRIDATGALLITAGITALVYGFLNANQYGWSSGRVVGTLAGGSALVVVFAIWQAISRDPLVPLRFFKNRTRVSANFATLFAGASFITMFFTVTLYMQDELNFSPLQTGLAWGPFGLMLFVAFGATAKFLPAVGVKRGVMFSFTTSAVGLYLMSNMSLHATYWKTILPGMLVMAFGQGISFVGLQNSSLHQLGNADAGIGSAVQNTSLQIGGSIGLAVLLTVALHRTTSKLHEGIAPAKAALDGYSFTLKLSAAVLIVGAVMVALLFEKVAFIPPEQAALAAAEAEAGVSGTAASGEPAGATA
jgi:EmrB/QacA subfamily drug resistance transporter